MHGPRTADTKTICGRIAIKNFLAAQYVYFEEAAPDKRNKLIKMTAEINTNGKLSRELARAVTRADFAREQNRIIFGDDVQKNVPAQKDDGKPLNTLTSPKAEETENFTGFPSECEATGSEPVFNGNRRRDNGIKTSKVYER